MPAWQRTALLFALLIALITTQTAAATIGTAAETPENATDTELTATPDTEEVQTGASATEETATPSESSTEMATATTTETETPMPSPTPSPTAATTETEAVAESETPSDEADRGTPTPTVTEVPTPSKTATATPSERTDTTLTETATPARDDDETPATTGPGTETSSATMSGPPTRTATPASDEMSTATEGAVATETPTQTKSTSDESADVENTSGSSNASTTPRFTVTGGSNDGSDEVVATEGVVALANGSDDDMDRENGTLVEPREAVDAGDVSRETNDRGAESNGLSAEPKNVTEKTVDQLNETAHEADSGPATPVVDTTDELRGTVDETEPSVSEGVSETGGTSADAVTDANDAVETMTRNATETGDVDQSTERLEESVDETTSEVTEPVEDAGDEMTDSIDEVTTATSGTVEQVNAETEPSETVDGGTVEGTVEQTTETIETVEETVTDVDIVDAVAGEVKETTDGVDEGVADTTATVDESLTTAVETVDETAGTVDVTVDGTAYTIERTTAETVGIIDGMVHETTGTDEGSLDSVDVVEAPTVTERINGVVSTVGESVSWTVTTVTTTTDATGQTVLTAIEGSTETTTEAIGETAWLVADDEVGSIEPLGAGDARDSLTVDGIGSTIEPAVRPQRHSEFDANMDRTATAVPRAAVSGRTGRLLSGASQLDSHGSGEDPLFRQAGQGTQATTGHPVVARPQSAGAHHPTVVRPGQAPDQDPTAVSVSGMRDRDQGPLGGEVPVPDAPVGIALLAAFGVGAAIARSSGTMAGLLAGTPGASLRLQARTAAGALRGWLGRLPRYLPFPGYSRYDDSDPLENDQRARLYEAITDSPGVDLSTLVADTDVSRSTARYHLRILEHEACIASRKVWGKRRLYPVHANDIELQAAVRNETTVAVLEAIARREPANGTTLATELDRDVSTVTHHLARLADVGLVNRERDGRAIVNRLTPAARRALQTRPQEPGPGRRSVESDD